mgnify:CR=1 FL=1
MGTFSDEDLAVVDRGRGLDCTALANVAQISRDFVEVLLSFFLFFTDDLFFNAVSIMHSLKGCCRIAAITDLGVLYTVRGCTHHSIVFESRSHTLGLLAIASDFERLMARGWSLGSDRCTHL